jgi:ATP-dependent DNA helicase RecG
MAEVTSESEFKALLLREINIQWLNQPSGLTIEDLSADALSFFICRGQNAGHIPRDSSSLNLMQILDRLNLLTAGEVTFAGALLFSDNPRKISDGAYLRICQFDANETLMRETCIEGPLIRLPDLAIEKLYSEYIQPTNVHNYGNNSECQKYDYSKTAVAELILNAIVHKDYGSRCPVTVAVYPDRLEIFSAGDLLGGMTVEHLTQHHTSILRNPPLASVFRSAGFACLWGVGIAKVRNECNSNGNPEPEFQEFRGGILVTVFKPKVKKTISDKLTFAAIDDVDRMILKLMSDNSAVTVSSISESIGLNVRSIQRRIRALRDAGIVLREGNKYRGWWIIAEDIDF